MSIHSTVPLLCNLAAALSSFFTNNNHNKLQQQPQPLLFFIQYIYIASVHIVHAISAIPLHAHTAPISSTSRVLCLIIMVTLQLLWQFSHAFSITGCYVEIPQPLWQLRLFVFSVKVELTFFVLVTGSIPSSCQSPPRVVFIPLADSMWLFCSSGNHTKVSSHPLVEPINGYWQFHCVMQ